MVAQCSVLERNRNGWRVHFTTDQRWAERIETPSEIVRFSLVFPFDESGREKHGYYETCTGHRRLAKKKRRKKTQSRQTVSKAMKDVASGGASASQIEGAHFDEQIFQCKKVVQSDFDCN